MRGRTDRRRRNALAPAALLAAALLFTGCGGGAARLSPAEGGPAGGPWPGTLHRLPPWDRGVPALLINVPEGYERGLRAGEGFMVHLFRRPPQVAPPDSATLAIYVGHHPREPRPATLREPGRVAGRDVTWLGAWWEDRGRTVYHAETQVRGLFRWPRVWRPDAQGLVVHVMAWGTDQREVERLIRAAESLRLEP